MILLRWTSEPFLGYERRTACFRGIASVENNGWNKKLLSRHEHQTGNTLKENYNLSPGNKYAKFTKNLRVPCENKIEEHAI